MNNFQNEVLSEERDLMKWVGIFWVLGGSFLGGNFPRSMFFTSLHFKVSTLKDSYRAQWKVEKPGKKNLKITKKILKSGNLKNILIFLI